MPKNKLNFKILTFAFANFFSLTIILLFYTFIASKRIFGDQNTARGLFVEAEGGYINQPGFEKKNITYICYDSGSRKEYLVDALIHSQGYRVDYKGETMEPGGVLALGCSVTWGWPCKNSETFSAVLAKKLKLPVYNFGTSSYGWYDAVRRYQMLATNGVLKELNPKVLVIGATDAMFDRSTSPFYPTWDCPLLHNYWSYNYKNESWELVEVPHFLNQNKNFRLAKNIMQLKPSITSELKKFLMIFGMTPRWIGCSLYRNYLHLLKKQDMMYPKPWLKQPLELKNVSLFLDLMLHMIAKASTEARVNPQIILLRLGKADLQEPHTFLLEQIWSNQNQKSFFYVDGYKEAEQKGLQFGDYRGHCPPIGHRAFGEAIYARISKNKFLNSNTKP